MIMRLNKLSKIAPIVALLALAIGFAGTTTTFGWWSFSAASGTYAKLTLTASETEYVTLPDQIQATGNLQWQLHITEDSGTGSLTVTQQGSNFPTSLSYWDDTAASITLTGSIDTTFTVSNPYMFNRYKFVRNGTAGTYTASVAAVFEKS